MVNAQKWWLSKKKKKKEREREREREQNQDNLSAKCAKYSNPLTNHKSWCSEKCNKCNDLNYNRDKSLSVIIRTVRIIT
jgi:hypothetical protein